MTSIYKTLAIIYRQYLYRKIPSPYFRTIMTIIGLLLLHVVHLVLLFNLPTYFILPGTSDTDSGIERYLKGGAYFGILIFIFYSLIDKKKVLGVEVNDREITKGKKILIIYFLIDLIIMVLLLIIRGIRMGTFHL